jgi:hypothetical protein
VVIKKEHIAEDLRSLTTAIAELHADPANARKHNPRNIDTIKASLAKFGQRKPIVVQRDGMVVRAGNGTMEAAKALGWSHIAAVVLDDDNATASAYAIADNRTAELAEWDPAALSALHAALDDELQMITGFTEGEIDHLLGSDIVSETSSVEGAFTNTVETYEAMQTRSLMLHFEEDAYMKVTAHLDHVMAEHGLLSHAEAVEFMCLGEV